MRATAILRAAGRALANRTMARSAAAVAARAYLKLTPEYADAAVRCVADTFAVMEDPFTRAFHMRSYSWAQMAATFIDRSAHAANPLSIVAFNRATGVVDGVMVNEDWLQPPPAAYMALPAEWHATQGIFRALHTRYNESPGAPVAPGDAIRCLYFTCVRPEVRSQGVMKGLWRHTIDVARDFGFKNVLAQAGGEHTRQVLEHHLGFREAVSIDYREYGKQHALPGLAELPKVDPINYSRLSLMGRKVPYDLY